MVDYTNWVSKIKTKEVVDKEGRREIVSSGVEDFRKYNGWTNWATWNINVWLDELRLTDLAREQNSPEYLQDLCEHFINDFSDFWEEDRFGNKYLDEKQWNNINWVELFNTYKEDEE